jgi:hypothetical protein
MSMFLQTLFALAPPGESPYAFATAEILKVLPQKANWFFWMLAVGSVVNAASVSP